MRQIGLFLAACAASVLPVAASADVPSRSGLSMYIERMVATALPYDSDRRWESYLTISRLAAVLRSGTPYSEELAVRRTETFPGFPLLVLTDEDGDGRGDFFAYLDAEREKMTLEFGAYFPAGRARPSWIVFNGGMLFEKDAAGELSFFWQTHQFIDRDDDGRFDLYVVNGADSDGDGGLGRTDTEWVFDEDNDGLIDRAERNVDGQATEIAPVDGVFPLSAAAPGGLGPGKDFPPLAGAIAADIVDALEGESR